MVEIAKNGSVPTKQAKKNRRKQKSGFGKEKKKKGKGEWELNVTISKDATFADLFAAIDAVEEKEGLDELHFESELVDNFDSETADEVLAFYDVQEDKATTTKVLDFFKEHGYTQSDVAALLPVRFKPERKK